MSSIDKQLDILSDMVSSEKTLVVLVVRIGDAFYAILAQEIHEVVPIMEIVPSPDGLPFMEGFINVRGELYVVIDLSKRFGNPRDAYEFANRILLIQYQNRNLAFIVDEILQMEEWGEDHYQKGLFTQTQSHFTGVTGMTLQGRVAQTMTLSKILKESELELLAKRD